MLWLLPPGLAKRNRSIAAGQKLASDFVYTQDGRTDNGEFLVQAIKRSD
jgi:hypothetical protein